MKSGISHAALFASLKRAKAELDEAEQAHHDSGRALEIKRAVYAALKALDPESSCDQTSPDLHENKYLARNGRQGEGGRGKAPGTLGKRWRTIMEYVVKEGNRHLSPDLWATAASLAGYPMEVKAARDWLRRSAESDHGYIERDGDTYRVSQIAIDKYNWNRQSEIEAVSSNAGTLEETAQN